MRALRLRRRRRASRRAARPGERAASRRVRAGADRRRRSGPASACRGRRHRPARRSAGRANRWKVTSADTGLPGRPKTTLGPRVPNQVGLPGFSATRQKSSSTPSSASAGLTWSCGPTDTPPGRSRHRPASSARPRVSTVWARSSRTISRAITRAPARWACAARAYALELRIWPGASGRAGLDQLVAGRQHRNARERRRTGPRPGRARPARPARRGPGRRPRVAPARRQDVLARPADVRPPPSAGRRRGRRWPARVPPPRRRPRPRAPPRRSRCAWPGRRAGAPARARLRATRRRPAGRRRRCRRARSRRAPTSRTAACPRCWPRPRRATRPSASGNATRSGGSACTRPRTTSRAAAMSISWSAIRGDSSRDRWSPRRLRRIRRARARASSEAAGRPFSLAIPTCRPR